MVKLGPPTIVFCVCREHVLWISNFLSSHATFVLLFGGRSRASVHGFVAMQDCLVL